MATIDTAAPCACKGDGACACAAPPKPAAPKLTWVLQGKGWRLVPEGAGLLQRDVSARAWAIVRADKDNAPPSDGVYAAVAEVLLGAVASAEEWRFTLTPSRAPRVKAGGPVVELWRLRHTLGAQVEWLLMGGAYAGTTPVDTR